MPIHVAKAIVNTSIRECDVTLLEKLMLFSHGFENEPNQEGLLFFADHSIILKHDSYDTKYWGRLWTDSITEKANPANKGYFDDIGRIIGNTYEVIFQNIVKRSNTLECVEIEGVMLPDEDDNKSVWRGKMGGFSVLITEDQAIARTTRDLLIAAHAKIKNDADPVNLKVEEGASSNSDLIMEPGGGSIWISVGNAAIHVVPGDETVSVSINSNAREDDEPIDEASASYAHIRELDDEADKRMG